MLYNPDRYAFYFIKSYISFIYYELLYFHSFEYNSNYFPLGKL